MLGCHVMREKGISVDIHQSAPLCARENRGVGCATRPDEVTKFGETALGDGCAVVSESHMGGTGSSQRGIFNSFDIIGYYFKRNPHSSRPQVDAKICHS